MSAVHLEVEPGQHGMRHELLLTLVHIDRLHKLVEDGTLSTEAWLAIEGCIELASISTIVAYEAMDFPERAAIVRSQLSHKLAKWIVDKTSAGATA